MTPLFHYKQKSNNQEYIIILRIRKINIYIYIYIYTNFFSSENIIVIKVTEYKLRKTAKKEGIIGYQTKLNKELLRIIYKLKPITENLSRNKLNKITKMQNLSLNKLRKNRKNE